VSRVVRPAPVTITLVVTVITACTSTARPAHRSLDIFPSPSVSAVTASPSPGPTAAPSLNPDAKPLRGADGLGAPPSLTAVAAAVGLPGASVRVVDASTGAVLLDRLSGEPMPPASTTKLLTATAAVTALGGNTQLVTSASVRHRPDAAGTIDGDLAIVGAGDPTLTRDHVTDGRASLQDLVDGIVSTGVKHITGRILADTSLFAPETIDPGWDTGDVGGGSVAPVQSLELDGGRITPGPWITPRVTSPALSTATTVAAMLRAKGVGIGGGVVVAPAAKGSVALAEVRGLSIDGLVDRMLQQSDNDIAESLGRLVAISYGRTADATQAGAAVIAVVQGLGVPVTGVSLIDTSGLSQADRLTAQTLVGVLGLITAAGHPALWTVLRYLPLAGESGTLATRFRTGPALMGKGKVRAKTGAISGVTTLAGVAPTRSGRLLLFSFALHTGLLSRAAAESELDQAAAALTTLA
jgi:D-alanyl-D-alanine carboxypeptidase/D-alanyl-D-alanine-endopeptidase (penicillin-binding protein 4)